MQQSELSQTLTLEEAFAHELAKDVKLKGGGTAIDPDTGQPLKPAKAIAMSRSSRPQLSVIGTEAQSHSWGGKLVNALTAASSGICLFVEL